jgi:hypothetical protein
VGGERAADEARGAGDEDPHDARELATCPGG